jgi:transposase-like protein
MGRIDDQKLVRLVAAGKSVTEIATIFGVSPSAVTQRRQKLEAVALREKTATPSVNVAGIDLAEQLKKINLLANTMADSLVDADGAGNALVKRPELLLKVLGELRQQIKTIADTARALYDIKGVKEFQSSVIETIAKEDPAVKDRIIAALKRRNTMAQFFNSLE